MWGNPAGASFFNREPRRKKETEQACCRPVPSRFLFGCVYSVNPGVPLKDILYRQCMLGGNYMLFHGDGGWKDPYYLGKAEMTEKFYRYVQENHENGF